AERIVPRVPETRQLTRMARVCPLEPLEAPILVTERRIDHCDRLQLQPRSVGMTNQVSKQPLSIVPSSCNRIRPSQSGHEGGAFFSGALLSCELDGLLNLSDRLFMHALEEICCTQVEVRANIVRGDLESLSIFLDRQVILTSAEEGISK